MEKGLAEGGRASQWDRVNPESGLWMLDAQLFIPLHCLSQLHEDFQYK